MNLDKLVVERAVSLILDLAAGMVVDPEARALIGPVWFELSDVETDVVRGVAARLGGRPPDVITGAGGAFERACGPVGGGGTFYVTSKPRPLTIEERADLEAEAAS